MIPHPCLSISVTGLRKKSKWCHKCHWGLRGGGKLSFWWNPRMHFPNLQCVSKLTVVPFPGGFNIVCTLPGCCCCNSLPGWSKKSSGGSKDVLALLPFIYCHFCILYNIAIVKSGRKKSNYVSTEARRNFPLRVRVQSAETDERRFTSEHEKRSYFQTAWEKRREQKYFINGRLTPVWVPLSAPYPTRAIFRAGYGVINYISTASLCSFDFPVIKSAIVLSGSRKCGSQVGEGEGARAVPDPWRCGENKGVDLRVFFVVVIVHFISISSMETQTCTR